MDNDFEIGATQAVLTDEAEEMFRAVVAAECTIVSTGKLNRKLRRKLRFVRGMRWGQQQLLIVLGFEEEAQVMFEEEVEKFDKDVQSRSVFNLPGGMSQVERVWRRVIIPGNRLEAPFNQ